MPLDKVRIDRYEYLLAVDHLPGKPAGALQATWYRQGRDSALTVTHIGLGWRYVRV